MAVVTITKGVVAPGKLSSSVLKACGLAFLATTLGFTSNNLYAANTHAKQHEQAKASTQTQKTQLEQQTLALAAKMSELHRANKRVKASDAAFEQQLQELVAERQANQYALLQLDAKAALRTILPNAKRSGMPAHIEEKLAQQAELIGELELVYEDHKDSGKDRLRYFLVTEDQRVELHLTKQEHAESINHGARVKVNGWLFKYEQNEVTNSSLALGEGAEIIMLQTGEGSVQTAATNTAVEPLPNTLGEQRTLVVLVNFQDNAGERPWSVTEVQDMVFGKVSDYYREASFGQTWLSGEVTGYHTLPIAKTCESRDINTYGLQAARDAGIDVGSYNRHVFVFPHNDACAWSGKGTLGGNPSRVWINGSLTLNTVGHELGHNLGLHHAEYLECRDQITGDNCTAVTYGDNMDIMGALGVEGHFNAFNKERLGWLTPEKGEVITADSDGNYVLEPFASIPSGGVKGLKVRRGTDETTGQPLWYYLEYRQAEGFDSFLANKANLTEGVVIRMASPLSGRGSQLLDMTPGSALYDMDDAALVAGKTYNDVEAGVTITTEWADSLSVGVNVSYSAQQSCVVAQPSIALTSNSSVWAEPGETVSYSATLTNNDSAECGNSNYNVSAQVPQDWSGTQQSVSLAPGESATVSVSVTSSNAATDGFYDVNIKGVNTIDSGYQASTTASYVVEAPVAACIIANPEWTLLNSSASEAVAGTTVIYSGTLTNKDDANCAASTFDINASLPAGWSADNPSVNLLPGQSETLNVSVTSAADASAGVYDFSLIALNRDNGGYQSSASATYQVAAPVASCQLAAPKLSVTDALGAEVEAGTEQLYNVEITNQNQDCADATYSLDIAAPSGWNATNSTVTLASGATTTVSLSVTSSTSASAGSYNLTLTAKDKVNTGYSSTSTLVYSVIEQPNHAPVANSDSATLTSKTAIYINVLSNDTDIDGDTLIVKSATQGAKGSVQVLSDGRIKFTPAKSFKDSDSFSYTISDGKLESTTTVSVTLASDGGSGGGGNKGKGRK